MSTAPSSTPAAPAEGAPPAAPRRSRLLVFGVAGLAGLAALGAAGWLLAPRLLGPRAPHKAEAKVQEAIKATVPLGPVVVNLAGDTGRYLKIGTELGLHEEKDAKAIEEAKPQLLDLLITVLSTKPAASLASGEGRAQLKQELLARIHDELGLKKVGRVYFTEFVIQ